MIQNPQDEDKAKKAEAYKGFRAEAEAAELTRKGKRAALSANADKINNISTVKVSDFDMPFWSMVVFMVKWAIASIPAILILMVLFAIFGGFFFAIFN